MEADEEEERFHEAKEKQNVDENFKVLTDRNMVERPSRTLHSSRISINKAGKGREADKTQQLDEDRNVVIDEWWKNRSERHIHPQVQGI